MSLRRCVPRVLLLVFAVAGCTSSLQQKESPAGLGAIREGSIRHDLFALASEEMKGRKTPGPGLDSAARYIALRFERDRLRPVNGSYLQVIPLNIVGLGDDNALVIETKGQKRSYTIKTEFTPFEMTANREAGGPVVFAGYGITAPEYGYDDYAGIDVRDKIVLVLRHEPGERDSTSVFDGVRPTRYSDVALKARIAKDHGALGVMVVTDPLNHTSLAPRGFAWPSLTRTIPHDALPISLGSDESSKLPVVHVGEEAIAQLLESTLALKRLQEQIDSSVTPHSFIIPGTVATIRTSTQIKRMSANNVVAFVEGSDPVLKNQLVVVGAHYDHVGVRKNPAPGADSVFRGADDNASGTAAMLAVADGFSDGVGAPKRSVLFIAFAGEEEGVLGSQYYVSHPLFPIDSTVAMLNLDMVGRNGEDSLYVIGSESSPDLALINIEENRETGFALLDEVRESGGSDHISFRQHHIPVLFYHSGLHADYHRVSDKPELINIRKVAKVARLVFKTAWHIATDNHRYTQRFKSTTIF